jgi:hypothetical protein
VKFELQTRDRRALLGLAAALVVFGFVHFVAFPIRDQLASAAATASEKEGQLRRYRRAQLRKGEYEQLIQVARRRNTDAESILMTGANASLVSAELQSMVEATAARVGLTLGQRSMGTPKKLNPFYSELALTLGFESTPGQLVALLAELHGMPKYINVRALQVSPVQPVQAAPQGTGMTKRIRVNMTIAVLSNAEIAPK